jgi:hypothetical protein
MCSVLAHELRSPLSVLQGYIRLLQRPRDPDHPEMAMLEAMLDATGRLTTIARQASDLGNWLAAVEAAPRTAVAVEAVAAAVAGRLSNDGPITLIAPPQGTGTRAEHTERDAAALAGAIVSLAESMHRDDETATIEISVSGGLDGRHPGFVLCPRSTGARTVHPTRSGLPRALAFDQGGAGLALIAASHVFDYHRVVLEPDDAPGSLSVRFPHTGGAQ